MRHIKCIDHYTLGQKKYNELLQMLYNGSILFLDRDQQISGADLGILLVDVLVKSEETDSMKWTPKLCCIFSKIDSSTPERETFLASAIRWSANGSSQGDSFLHQSIAQIYWNEKNYTQARHHYIHSKDGNNCAKLLIEFQSVQGFKCEADLFIAQAVFQFLCLSNKVTASQTFATYTEEHPTIKKSGPPYLFPLLNFIWFLLQAIDSKKLQTFAVLCEQYEVTIKRDPCYVDYLDKIGQIFFGLKPPQQKQRGLFGNFFESFLTSLDEDSDDDSAPRPSSSQRDTTRLLENAELD
ncbi:hypothetical protein WA026_001186 [Henosepilachna vigintioctopunctata]|uniref:Golgi to ER traffic protein 4 homolog n=1 Tax=Henosepilachna vigintioctopunctata TaxID=420089 RepID=A0AAW1UKE6_9CUCU